MIRNMYHNRSGFDFEKVFPPLPEDIAVAKDGADGMRFKSLNADAALYYQFLNSLPAKGFKTLPEGTVVWRRNKYNVLQKKTVSGEAFYKDLGKGFGAVAEYNGDFCALYLICGMGE